MIIPAEIWVHWPVVLWVFLSPFIEYRSDYFPFLVSPGLFLTALSFQKQWIKLSNHICQFLQNHGVNILWPHRFVHVQPYEVVLYLL